MKMFLASVFLALFTIGTAATLYAAPERLELKDPQRKEKERAAKAQIKNIDIQDIEDPAARKAIREILRYLNLQTA